MPFPSASETFGCVLNDGDVVAIGDFHDSVDVVRHSVERHGHDGLGFLARLGDTVLDGLFHQLGVNVPRILLTVDEDRCRTEIGNRVRRGAEGERLHDDLVARPDAAVEQRQMHRRRARRQRDDTFAKIPLAFWRGVRGEAYKCLQVLLEPVHVRPQWHHPIGVEGLLDILLFKSRFAHVGEAEVDSFICHFVFYSLSEFINFTNLQRFPTAR